MYYDNLEENILKIIDGTTNVKIKSGCCEVINLVIKEPSIKGVISSISLYRQKIKEAESVGIIRDDEAVEKLISLNLWSHKEQEQIDSVPDKIENLKVQLYLAYKNFKSRDAIKKQLVEIREELDFLYRKKNVLHDQTCEGLAELIKLRYLVCSEAFYENGDVFFKDTEYEDEDNTTVSSIIYQYIENMMSDEYIRNLSKHDMWRTLWNVGKAENGVFGKSAVELTKNQKSMVNWSRIYDAVHESHECPNKAVLEDNDMLDGWLIYQNRKTEKEKSEQSTTKDAKVKGNEIYLFADNQEDAKRIHNLNDSQGKANIKSLNNQIDKNEDGLKAQKTLEAKLEMRQMSNEQFKQKARG